MNNLSQAEAGLPFHHAQPFEVMVRPKLHAWEQHHIGSRYGRFGELRQRLREPVGPGIDAPFLHLVFQISEMPVQEPVSRGASVRSLTPGQGRYAESARRANKRCRQAPGQKVRCPLYPREPT